jgi:hypothetical protein
MFFIAFVPGFSSELKISNAGAARRGFLAGKLGLCTSSSSSRSRFVCASAASVRMHGRQVQVEPARP